jgi:hypothetical protein
MSGASITIGGGGKRKFISIPPLPSIFKKALIPLLWVDRPTLFIYFIVPTYLPMLELVYMNRDPLPYPPQMRNGGSPPAHLLSSPHSDPAIPPAVNVAAIVAAVMSALESSLLVAIAAMSAEKALAEEKHCQEAVAQEKALADEANKRCQMATREKALANNAHE